MAPSQPASPRGLASSTSSINLIRSTLARGGEHLGDLVWWSLSDVRVSRGSLESAWASAALDSELLVEPPSPEKAFKLAIREAQVGLKDRLLRLGKESETEVVFAIIREQRDTSGNVTHQQESRVLLDRLGGSLSSDSPNHEVVSSIEAGYRQLRHTHTADDVRRTMLRLLDRCAAVTLREHGGVYWVPTLYADDVRRMQKAVEQIGASRVHLLPVHRSADSERTLGAVAQGSLETELAALEQELTEFLSSPPARASTLEHRLEAFEALRAKARLYGDVLRIQLVDVESKLDELTGYAESLLHQKDAA